MEKKVLVPGSLHIAAGPGGQALVDILAEYSRKAEPPEGALSVVDSKLAADELRPLAGHPGSVPTKYVAVT